MFKSYLIVALRSLKKNKLYTSINIIGLTVGIASCLLIGLYVWNELEYDRFNEKGNRIVRMVMEYSKGGSTNKIADCGTKAGPQLSRTFPSIEAFTRTIKNVRIVGYEDKVFEERRFLYADSAFFTTFSFPLLQGDPRTALNAPYQVVISEDLAKKYFGRKDPMGKVLKVGNAQDYVVTGVAANPPGNSQVQFDLVGSFTSLPQSATEQWWTANYTTYLLLHKPEQMTPLQQDISRYMKNVSATELEMQGNDYLTYKLERLFDVHLYSSVGAGLEGGGNITYVFVLSTIALLILIIACVNYMNLATAQSTGRGTEIAVRKVLGAGGGQLFRQFMGESGLLTLFSLTLAVAVAIVSLPSFSTLTGQLFTPGMLLHPVPLVGLALLGVFICFLSGSYPAFILASSKVIRMLKSGFRVTSAGNGVRRSLIVLQFVISVFLIVSTIIILKQLSYIQHKDLGYDKDHIIILPIDYQIRQNYTALKNAILTNPGIVSVSGGYEAPTHIQWGDDISGDNGSGAKDVSVNAIPVDVDFTKTLGMQLLAGADFTRQEFSLMDTSDNDAHFRYSFIVNEQLIKEFGWTPQQAIGKTISKGSPGTIVGVVKDFHFASLREPIGKMVIFLDTSMTRELYVKISGGHIPATLDFLGRVWKERVPHRPFEYHFLDDDYAALYVTEQRTALVFSVFAGLAIVLACLGLFALAAYTTVQRTKEIGIRKILGATLGDITTLVTGDFIKLVLIGVIIASPLAWYSSHVWLSDFAYRTSISWWMFAVAGLLSVVIAYITVGFHAVKAAAASPIKSLRTE